MMEINHRHMTTPFFKHASIFSKPIKHKSISDAMYSSIWMNDTVLKGFRLDHFICKEHKGAHNIQIYLFIAQGYCSKQGYGTLN